MVVSSHHDRPISDDTNTCPASGTVETRELMTIDSEPSHPYATTVQAKVTFTDGVTYTSAVMGTADVPPLPAPPPPLTYTLTGRITDISTHVGITGARLEVITGLNVGETATTDGSGLYLFPALKADGFRLRASANDYLTGEQGVTVPANPRADFELRHTSPACTYQLKPDYVFFPWKGSTQGFTITTGLDCEWTATADEWMFLNNADGGVPWPKPLTHVVTGKGSGLVLIGVGVHIAQCDLTGFVRVRGTTGGGADVRVVFGAALGAPIPAPPCAS